MAVSKSIVSLWSFAVEYPIQTVVAIFFCWIVFWTIYTRFFHPVSGVPGPFLASITRLWYVRKVQGGQFNKLARQLHRQYGPLVRIAPNEVSISDPEAVKIIYNSRDDFTKTDFYSPFTPPMLKSPHDDLFSNTNNKLHAQRRRIVNNLYSMTSVLESEQYIDSCTELFVDRLERFAKTQEQVDLGEWVEMYAFDVIGELFFGQKFGFLESGSDVEHFISSMEILLPVLGAAAILPVGLRTVWMMSGLVFPSIRKALPRMDLLNTSAIKQVKERQDKLDSGSQDNMRQDILAKLFDLRSERRDTGDFQIIDIQREAFVAIIAGSDTTAIEMRSILYNILKNPNVYEKLQNEIDLAAKAGIITFPVRYADAIKLPYFTACCKEGMRMHPSAGLIFPRHVPAGGRNIAGYMFEAGCRVGVNPAVLHFDTEIFGADAEHFNPDRWLGANAANMDRYMLQFGAGSRTCLGKNISLAEIHKLIPHLLHRFRFELAQPTKPMVSKDFWFNKQWGLLVRVHER